MQIDGPWLYFVWSSIAAYAVILGRSLWRRRRDDASFPWLLAALVTAVIRQGLIAAWAIRIMEKTPWLIGLTLPLQILFLTFCTLFVSTFTRRQPLGSKRKLALYVPALIALGWYVVVLVTVLNGQFDYDSAQVMHRTGFNLIRVTLVLGFGLFVVWHTRQDIAAFESEAREQLSNLVQLRAPLLKALCYITVASSLLPALDFITGPEVQLWPLMPIGTLVSLFVLTQYALDHSRLFHVDNAPKAVALRDRLRPDEAADIEAKLRRAIKDHQLYLKPDFRLLDLADHIGVKPYKVSATLSGSLKTSFFDYINGFRVEHAKRLLRSPKHAHLNLMGIAMDTGFNSKSTFNDSFKRATGLTPSEFRRQLSEVATSDDQTSI